MMQDMRTLAVVTLLTIAGITPAHSTGLSEGLSPLEQAQAFATCAGRLQALATRQSAVRDPRSSTTRALQGDFEMLLEATLPFALDAGTDPGEARRWQASGWVEIASLLSRAQYTPDELRAAHAEAAMAARIVTCRRMIMRG
ncbi:MAG: hypothetical protein RIG84_01465 [Roseovarius sp.]